MQDEFKFLRRFSLTSAVTIALFCVAMAGVPNIHAATLTVTNTADSGAGSLRQALADAIDGDTIQFDATLNGQTIGLTSAELVIDKNITVSGPGLSQLTVQRSTETGIPEFRIFHVLPGRTVVIEGLKINAGRLSETGAGGGVRNDQATLTLNNCAVVSNFGGQLGGGIYNDGGEASLTIVNCTIGNNGAGIAGGGRGGGIYNNNGTLEISDSTIIGNVATEFCGGIYNTVSGTLSIRSSVVDGNSVMFQPPFAGRAGGIFNAGTAEITNCTISHNAGVGQGGGVDNEGSLTITDSTLSNNTSVASGGGISNSGPLTITNSTISGNTASFKGFGNGGGIFSGNAPLTISNSTISGNSAGSFQGVGGGIYIVTGTLEIENTILNASGTGGNIFNNSGTVISHGYNLSSDDGGGFLTATGDQTATDPILGPLQDNGGPTFTHALLAGSPAIDAGDPNFIPPPVYDQRGPGYDRVYNGRIDIGSFELQPGAPTPTPTPSPTASATPTPSPTATATPVTPTATPTPTDTNPPSPTPTPTPSPTASATPPPTPTPSPTATPSPGAAQALNISTRLRVETGDRIMIGGFIITGNEPKKVAIRGIGPSLGNSGLSDVLADPTLELRGPDGALLMQNDNWQDDLAQAAQLVALGLALQDPKESGIVATLQPGLYTALMAGKNQTSGIGLVEIYDADAAADSQLANISTRGFVRTADNVMIGGFILGNSSAGTNVVVRGLGPSLDRFMLIDVLADPTLELRDANGGLLIANDNWQDDPVSAAQLIAHGLAPPRPQESGIFTRLAPGAFTAILTGKNGGVGLGLMEVYDVVDSPTPTATPTPTVSPTMTPAPTSTPARLIVTSTADSEAGSLRDTIAAANGGDIIEFDAALNGQTIGLTSAELVIDKDIAISGPAPNLITVSRDSNASLSFRIFHVMPGRTVIIEGLTIRGGNASSPGGGIRNDQATLTVNSCTVGPNFSSGGSGGGIYNDVGGETLVINSTVSDNWADGAASGGAGIGGGVSNRGTMQIRNSVVTGNRVSGAFPFPLGGAAGGISNEGMMEIRSSTISGNRAGNAGGGIVNGGIMTVTDSTVVGNALVMGGAGGGVNNAGTMTISNSTVSGNTTSFKQSGNGGGIYNSGPLTISNSTVSGNSADGNGDSIFNSFSMLEIGNTILKTGSSDANIFNNSGTVTSQGYNLASDDGGGFLTAAGDQINTDPMLGPLQSNGGPTVTHELLTGSPAIDAGDPNFTPPPFYDQRGQPGYDRVYNGRIDIGSFEVQPCCPPTPTPGLRR